jgi:uncharacterized membrane protein HdeD (DUF308 family)
MEKLMSSTPPPWPGPPALDDVAILQRSGKWLLIEGLALIVLGIFSLAATLWAALAVTVFFALVLLMAGISEIGLAVWAPRWRGVVLHFLAGILYVIVGAIMLENPLSTIKSLTLLLAVCLFVNGALRIGYALTERFTGWMWALLSGVISLILGVIIWRRWPWDSEWVIGVYVGVELLFAGWSCVMVALFFRQPTLTQR